MKIEIPSFRTTIYAFVLDSERDNDRDDFHSSSQNDFRLWKRDMEKSGTYKKIKDAPFFRQTAYCVYGSSRHFCL